MESTAAWLVVILMLAVSSAALSRRLPKRFLTRGCMGREWRRHFPSAAKDSIRRFLGIFVGAFGLPVRHGLRFSPDDQVLDVYRDMYPVRGLPDELELERFVLAIRRE